MILSVIAIIYASFAAMAQKDIKKMIAYSSIAHMGYVSAGIFSLDYLGISGAIFQMLSHGVISSMLFFIIGSLYDRVHSKQIASYGGIAQVMPMLACFFMIAMLASIGMPGTSGFIGEFLCLNAIFYNHYVIACFSVIGILLGAIYMISLYKDVVFGVIQNQRVYGIGDLNIEEKIVLAFLSGLVILFGIAPNFINNITAACVKNISKVFVW
jgi:NADH-quinone oxidoreductase subunit M